MFAAFTVMSSNKYQPHASRLHEPSIHHFMKKLVPDQCHLHHLHNLKCEEKAGQISLPEAIYGHKPPPKRTRSAVDSQTSEALSNSPHADNITIKSHNRAKP
ncbi:hypothetical protein SRHO_G00172480 [Serrasalmus rhombeus]